MSGEGSSGGGWMASITSGISAGLNFAASLVGMGDLEVMTPDGKKVKAGEGDANSKELWTMLKDMIGADLTRVTLPVWLFEPTSFLQKIAEGLEYAELLSEGAKQEESWMRTAYVAAYAISVYGSTERLYKPFNPFLGETFEFVRDDIGMKFFAEQVSHHPPIAAAQTETDSWRYWQVSEVSTKFLGNSCDIYPRGKTVVEFANGEKISFTSPTTTVHNLVIGGMWIDHHGVMEVVNHTTGDRAEITFEKCGWFAENRYRVHGFVNDAAGKRRLGLIGKWNEHVDFLEYTASGSEKADGQSTVWRRKAMPAAGTGGAKNKYGFSTLANTLADVAQADVTKLPPTDARLRRDRLELFAGNSSSAAAWKHKLEEQQRKERKERKEAGTEWTPRYFKRVADELPLDEADKESWRYQGGYWEARDSADGFADGDFNELFLMSKNAAE